MAIPQEVGAYPKLWYRKIQQRRSAAGAAVGVAENEPKSGAWRVGEVQPGDRVGGVSDEAIMFVGHIGKFWLGNSGGDINVYGPNLLLTHYCQDKTNQPHRHHLC